MSAQRAGAQRGRLGAYSLWQLRDYFTTVAGIGTVLLPFIIGVVPMLLMKTMIARHGGSDAQIATQIHDPGLQAFDLLVNATAWLGAMLGIATLVSADRQPGLSRFLFSKPVSVSRYYLQAWAVRGVALAAVMLVLAQVANVFVLPVPWLEGVAFAGIAWVLIAGVGLLLSVLTARDGLALVFIYLLVISLDGMHRGLPKLLWPQWALYVLPPMQKLEAIRHALLQGTAMPVGDLWHVILYGAGCTALATYLVRRLPLVR